MSYGVLLGSKIATISPKTIAIVGEAKPAITADMRPNATINF